jgi:hypothetical protein
MLATCLILAVLGAAPPESEIADNPPSEQPAPVAEGPAPPPEPAPAEAPADPAPEAAAEPTPLPDVAGESPEAGAPTADAPAASGGGSAGGSAGGSGGASASAGVGVSAGAGAAADATPEATVAKEQPRDTARSHESRWAFAAAGLAHSARPGRRAWASHPDPGIALTSELRMVRGENSQLWLGLEGAYWADRGVSRTTALRAQFGYRLILGMGLGFEMYGGPGLAWHRYQDAALQCVCTNGKPRQTGFVGGMGAGVLYDFGQVTRLPIAVYGRYEAFIERHLGAPDFYLVPHQAVHVGVRLTLPGRRR